MRSKIKKHLSELADLMEFNGENRFKINAFRNGAFIIGRLDEDIEDLIRSGGIKNIKGIGKGIQAAIAEFIDNGISKEYLEQVADLPEGIMKILSIRGLGAKKVRILYDELKIDSLDELEDACRKDNIASIKGFGSKTQAKILEEIDRMRKNKGFLRIDGAYKIAEDIKLKLSGLKSIEDIRLTGELRRIREVISKIQLILLINNSNIFEKELAILFKYNKIDISTETIKYNLLFDPNIIIEIYACSDKNEFDYRNNLLTGSEQFIEKLKLSSPDPIMEQGIFSQDSEKYIIPEMREQEWFSLSDNLKKNSELTNSDFKGFLHFHTVFSDGTESLEKMTDKALNFGYEYFAVCDHSKTAAYANGLKPERIIEQRKEIENIKKMTGKIVFQGIESDILRDGSLDYDESILSEFQFIVASVHSIFTLPEEEMTQRIIKAVENPNTDVLGHPSGRLLLTRDPYKINIKKIIDACSENDVAIEINSNPYRLDLDWRNIYYAREKGCKFSINQDAHSSRELEHLEWGIKIARKAGIQPEEVINCFEIDKFKSFLTRKVNRKL